jgi:hypothetical protein
MQVLGVHPQTPVVDLDNEAARSKAHADAYLGVLGRNVLCVLDEFGEQVDDVRDRVPGHPHVGHRQYGDPPVASVSAMAPRTTSTTETGLRHTRPGAPPDTMISPSS